MTMNEQEMIESDYDELSDSEILVLLIMNENKPILKTRLQKVSLLYHELYDSEINTTGHNAYFFGGYSDDIDESAADLVDKGIMEENRNGYRLTEYGTKLVRFIREEYDDVNRIAGIDKINRSVESVPDRNLVGLTYHFYEESAMNSTIKESVDKMNSVSSYDGVPLKDYPKDQFELKLRNGDRIRVG